LLRNASSISDIPVKPSELTKIDYSQDFFGKPAYLTGKTAMLIINYRNILIVSGQLNGEMYATALGKIYTFGPTFR
jgi:asparaginyl-tRNA synthetase